jgi:pantoate kinase
VIIISLLLRRNPSDYIFHNIILDPTIDLETAKMYYKKFIKSRIDELLAFKSLKKTFEFLKIPGLEEFIRSALNFESK